MEEGGLVAAAITDEFFQKALEGQIAARILVTVGGNSGTHRSNRECSGVEKQVSRRPHKPKITGSNPVPATTAHQL